MPITSSEPYETTNVTRYGAHTVMKPTPGKGQIPSEDTRETRLELPRALASCGAAHPVGKLSVIM